MHSRLITTIAIIGLVGCGVFGAEDNSAPPDTTPAPPPDPGTGTDGGLPEGAPPPPVGTPGDAELTDAFGVFVSAAATPGGDGTKAHPFATIGAGIDRVKDLKLRVYVCAGTYAESLTLVNAVSVIGSLGCDGGMWTTMGTGRSIITAPTSPAIRAKDISLATRFEGFDVSVPGGTATAPTSIALIAENASMLTVAKSTLTSANAFAGADGTDGTPLTSGTTLTGKNGSPFTGALANPITGPQPQIGGLGGVGSCIGAAGHDGENGKQGGSGATEICTAFTHLNTGMKDWRWDLYVRGGVPYNRSDGVAGAGAGGGAGASGASATSYGIFTPDGFAPSDGTAGADGTPGHGGGGGNGAPTTFGQPCASTQEGAIIYDASGPGGGAGGCPGLAGTAGKGGGASIAALVFNSPGLSFTTCELRAGNGGNAGKGSFPSAVTFGGNAGTAPIGATAGVAGGPGGPGGFSGNGAGGPSAALAYTGGDVVVAQDTHTTPGTAGAGVASRAKVILGATVTIPESPAGPAMPVLKF